jgi:23S rRNA (pseudouridine1915-N3)-methyltransferase
MEHRYNYELRITNYERRQVNIDLITVGKTDSAAVAELVAEYSKRIGRWVRFGVVMLPDVKRTGRGSAVGRQASEAVKRAGEAALAKAEGEMLLKQFAPEDYVVLLDDKGQAFSSLEFAGWLQRRLAGVGGGAGDGRSGGGFGGGKRLCFVVGGAYGFSPAVYARANEALSLSRMTFSHQIVRAIFAEQLYRALSILHGEPYHHE